MEFDTRDIEGLRFSNISGDVFIRTHEKDSIDILSLHEDKLNIQEIDGVLSISYNKDETETIKKNFIEKIFKRSFKLNLPINSSYVEENNTILIYNLLYTQIEVYVPKSIIEHIYIDGYLTLIGDDFTPYLRVYSVGSNTLRLSNIRNVYVDSQGKIECFLDDICNSSFYLNGEGFVRLNGKVMHSLKVKTKGNIDLDSIGQIQELQCDLSGISNINIFGKVTNKQIKKKGISKINIYT